MDNVVPVILIRNEEFWLPFTLEATRGRFNRYVVYDVGSEDRTRSILTWFMNSNPGVDFRYRALPFCEPAIQGTFRNAIIAEAESDHYFMLDGDEYYPASAMDEIKRGMSTFIDSGKMFGMVRRLEVTNDLTQVHGRNEYVEHTRIYPRTATWIGPHPGEDSRIEQTKSRKYFFDGAAHCFHFHQPSRSSRDKEVPGREGRRYKPTYIRGNLTPFNILEEIPLMRAPIRDFPINPYLEALQRGRSNQVCILRQVDQLQ